MSQKQRPVRAGGDWSPFGRAGVGVPYDSLEMQASQRTRRRLRLAVALFSVVFTVLVGRLFNLTILHVPTANASAQNSAQSAAERPDILDRNGRVLATQIMATTLGIDLDKIRDRDGLIEDLSKILNPDHLPQLERARERKGFLEVANNLSPEQKRAVLALGNPHLKLEDAPIRVYPSGPVAAHITGFVGRDQTGFSGLEYYLDRNELLTEDLQTSIDINVQHVTRHGLASAIKRYSAKSGTAIITDVNSGEIISLVSLPDFDPNRPMRDGGRNHFNKAVSGLYELGSIFKVFTVALALDSKSVTQEDVFDTREPLRVGKYKIDDSHGQRRLLTAEEILVYSSNIGSALLAMEIAPDTQQKFWGELGFFERVKVELPGRSIPQLPDRLTEINRMTTSYGHGISVSPLQAISAISAMVNGGILFEPTLLKTDMPIGHRVIKSETSAVVRDMMRDVMVRGTGKRADLDGYRMIGKTGSANIPENGGYAEDKLINSFVAAFPHEAPRYAIIVVLSEPQGIKETYGLNLAAWNAVPTASEIIARAGPLLGIYPNQVKPDVVAQRDGPKQFGKPGKLEELEEPLLVAGGR